MVEIFNERHRNLTRPLPIRFAKSQVKVICHKNTYKYLSRLS